MEKLGSNLSLSRCYKLSTTIKFSFSKSMLHDKISNYHYNFVIIYSSLYLTCQLFLVLMWLAGFLYSNHSLYTLYACKQGGTTLMYGGQKKFKNAFNPNEKMIEFVIFWLWSLQKKIMNYTRNVLFLFLFIFNFF